MKIPARLVPLLDVGIIDRVVRPLMSGKEAAVYLVEVREELRVAKVYKEAAKRSFKHRTDYTEGRKVRNSRRQRAMDKRSKYGRREVEQAWRTSEVDAIRKLRAAGVIVPEPFEFYEGVLVMELIEGEPGMPAPRLIDVHLTAAEARQLHGTILSEIVKMLCAGVVHGDLSDFNVLLRDSGPVIIDFPQAIDPTFNNNARKLFIRDVDNICGFLGRFAPELLQTRYGKEIWHLYERGDLHPEIELTGRFKDSTRVADVGRVLDEIGDAREEAMRRLGEWPPDEGSREPSRDEPRSRGRRGEPPPSATELAAEGVPRRRAVEVVVPQKERPKKKSGGKRRGGGARGEGPQRARRDGGPRGQRGDGPRDGRGGSPSGGRGNGDWGGRGDGGRGDGPPRGRGNGDWGERGNGSRGDGPSHGRGDGPPRGRGNGGWEERGNGSRGDGPRRGRGNGPRDNGDWGERRDGPRGGGPSRGRGNGDWGEQRDGSRGDGPPRGRGDGPRGRGDGPRGRGDGPRGRGDGPRGRGDGPRGRGDGPHGNGDWGERHGGHYDDGPSRGRGDGPSRGRGDGPRGRGDGPRGRGDGPRGRGDGPPRGRGDGPPRGRGDGPRGRGDGPRGRGDGPPRGRGDGPPRGRGDGPPRGRGRGRENGPSQGRDGGPPRGRGGDGWGGREDGPRGGRGDGSSRGRGNGDWGGPDSGSSRGRGRDEQRSDRGRASQQGPPRQDGGRSNDGWHQASATQTDGGPAKRKRRRNGRPGDTGAQDS